jgi:hypothetical protein
VKGTRTRMREIKTFGKANYSGAINEQVDSRTKSQTIGTHKNLETLGDVHRCKDRRRQVKGIQERLER